MNRSITELIAALSDKGELLNQLQGLLQEEQGCLTSLDLARLEENQQEMADAMDRLGRLSESCRKMIESIGSDLGLAGNASLSPIIARLAQPEQKVLREAQARIAADSQALSGALTLNRGLLEDSLKVVDRSVNFFNRLFNPGDTYGGAGSLVARRGGSRFVCKEA
ncbi:MAG: flagellar biosynthesis protein FlgN [Geobacteraceae bacterium GWC2_58_44]|nr:MAG: flagellar biosynthesis protein FlgN [Geobacteraceae bacterium GWC2_58_44]